MDAECKYCVEGFDTVNKLLLHIKNFHEQDISQARHQSDIYNRSVGAGDLKEHPSNEPHQCEICHKRFSRAHLLKDHMYTHSKDKPYKCKLCDKQYACKNHLKRHMLTHTKRKKK